MALLVVAEGVETHEQLDMLRKLGCHQVQGYLIGKPLPIAAYSHITSAKPVAPYARTQSTGLGIQR
jgi:EAL domain-containing protein (putative c-di-GMP-specific phosphodiesterase class I)